MESTLQSIALVIFAIALVILAFAILKAGVGLIIKWKGRGDDREARSLTFKAVPRKLGPNKPRKAQKKAPVAPHMVAQGNRSGPAHAKRRSTKRTVPPKKNQR